MTHLRIIGDVHGHIDQYIKLAQKAEYSIQVGDVGFEYSKLSLDPTHHRIVGGNHDNYTTDEKGNFVKQTPHFLGNFGFHYVEDMEIFYIRGAYSVDKHHRIEGLSWWPGEELTTFQMYDCMERYKLAKPDFIVSHECPLEMVQYLFSSVNVAFGFKPSKTQQFLQRLWEEHKPKNWIFGHHHQRTEKEIDGCKFVCLNSVDNCMVFDRCNPGCFIDF